jgi:hypothetical protein
MKKFLVFFVIGLFAVSMAFAAGTGSQSDTLRQPTTIGQAEDSGNPAETGDGTQVTQNTQNQGENTQIQTQQQTQTNNPGMGEQVRTQVQTGSLTTQSGKQVQIQTQSNNQVQLKSGTATAQTSMKMIQEQTATGTKLQVQLSNGQNAEIKIMPDAASEKALERLGLKVCTVEEGCSIELKEVGTGTNAQPAYEVEAQTEGKFLGLFKIKAKVKTQISAENGEILRVKKPFLTTVKTVETTE